MDEIDLTTSPIPEPASLDAIPAEPASEDPQPEPEPALQAEAAEPDPMPTPTSLQEEPAETPVLPEGFSTGTAPLDPFSDPDTSWLDFAGPDMRTSS